MELACLADAMANDALELMGPQAALAGPRGPCGGIFQAALLENPCMRIAGGTDEIQYTIVGECLLGLPPERPVPHDPPFSQAPRGGGFAAG